MNESNQDTNDGPPVKIIKREPGSPSHEQLRSESSYPYRNMRSESYNRANGHIAQDDEVAVRKQQERGNFGTLSRRGTGDNLPMARNQQLHYAIKQEITLPGYQMDSACEYGSSSSTQISDPEPNADSALRRRNRNSGNWNEKHHAFSNNGSSRSTSSCEQKTSTFDKRQQRSDSQGDTTSGPHEYDSPLAVKAELAAVNKVLQEYENNRGNFRHFGRSGEKTYSNNGSSNSNNYRETNTFSFDNHPPVSAKQNWRSAYGKKYDYEVRAQTPRGKSAKSPFPSMYNVYEKIQFTSDRISFFGNGQQSDSQKYEPLALENNGQLTENDVLMHPFYSHNQSQVSTGHNIISEQMDFVGNIQQQVRLSEDLSRLIKSTAPMNALTVLVGIAMEAGARNLHINLDTRRNHKCLELRDDRVTSNVEALNRFKLSINDGGMGKHGDDLIMSGLCLGKQLIALTKTESAYTMVSLMETGRDENTLFVQQNLCQCDLEDESIDSRLISFERHASLAQGELQLLFDKIEGHGSCMVIKQLRAELDVFIDATADDDENQRYTTKAADLCKKSLKELLSIEFLHPCMKITVQGQTVVPREICEFWVAKHETSIEVHKHNQAIEAMKKQLAKLKENKLKFNHGATFGYESSSAPENDPWKNKYLRENKYQYEEQFKQLSDFIQRGKNAQHKVVVGLETVNPENSGIFVYVDNRLIKCGSEILKTGRNNLGLSAYVNLDSTCYPLSPDKREFLHGKDFKYIMERLDRYLETYKDYLQKIWLPKYLKADKDTDASTLWNNFWEKLSVREYVCNNAKIESRKLAQERVSGVWRLCEGCELWEHLQDAINKHKLDSERKTKIADDAKPIPPPFLPNFRIPRRRELE